MTSNPKRGKPRVNQPKQEPMDNQMVRTFRHAASWGRRFNESTRNPAEMKWTKAQRELNELEWKHALESELKNARGHLAKVNAERKKHEKKPLTFYELEELIRKSE